MVRNRLTEGNILKTLVGLAVPIMGTSFIQMAYSMTDMAWVGHVGPKAVAAVGTAGFFTWLAWAFIVIPKIGAEVGVAQSIGRKDINEARNYIRHTIQMNVVFAILYGIVLIIFRKSFIGFFRLGSSEINSMAISYLVIVSIGMVFFFLPPVLTAIFNGYGDSRTPFMVNTVGLLTNIVLDPVLIFGVGPFPRMGVAGAAIATIFAQFVVTVLFLYNIIRKTDLFKEINFFKMPDWDHIRKIVKLGIPVALQSGMFTIFAMIIARIVARWGAVAIAAQNIGSQIESISWMTAGGFQTALSAFVGQNYGADKWDRVYKGYYTALSAVAVVGVITTSLLILIPGAIFSIFIPEAESVRYGIVYLQILGVSQFFMCLEITTSGAFNGLGRTIPPSVVGIILNALRIPGALLLSIPLGLNGVWWSISISSVFKGIILTSWFIIFLRRHPKLKLRKHTTENLELELENS